MPEPRENVRARRTTVGRLLRWAVSFLGFPVAGGIEVLLVGRIDSLGAALAGGLITGLGLGAIQGWALGAGRGLMSRWTLATAVGLGGGLAVGASAVDYSTSLGALVTQGAICGAVVGGAQSIVLLPLVGRIALAWPPYLAGVWAAGWAVTTLGGISVEDQFAVFGAYGAVVATALTAILPMVLHRDQRRPGPSPHRPGPR